MISCLALPPALQAAVAAAAAAGHGGCAELETQLGSIKAEVELTYFLILLFWHLCRHCKLRLLLATTAVLSWKRSSKAEVDLTHFLIFLVGTSAGTPSLRI
jgi:hypothetical protein